MHVNECFFFYNYTQCSIYNQSFLFFRIILYYFTTITFYLKVNSGENLKFKELTALLLFFISSELVAQKQLMCVYTNVCLIIVKPIHVFINIYLILTWPHSFPLLKKNRIISLYYLISTCAGECDRIFHLQHKL